MPAGALSQRVKITFQGLFDDTPLPETAERVGPAVKLLPEGTVLAAPATLTLPLNREMVAAYEQTPATCKVWARKADGWERLEQVRSTPDTVSVAISSFTTAAAGVNFSLTTTCTKDPAACEPAPRVVTLTAFNLQPVCEKIENAPFCIAKLPLAEAPRGIDEFSTLNIVGRKVYWAMSSDAGATIARLDLDQSSAPLFKYPAYAGSVSGTVEGKGVVQVVGPSAWVGLSGVGNLLFSEAGSPVVFDAGTGVGVGATGDSRVFRLRRQNVVNNGFVSKTDVRAYKGTTNEFDFAFNYPITPSENVVTYPGATILFVRSVHRGLAKMEDQAGPAGAFMKWDAQDGRLGTQDDDDTITYGAAAFNGATAAIARGNTIEIRNGTGYKTLVTSLAPPGGVRDLAFGVDGRLYAVSSRAELYVITPGNGALQTVPLPTDEVGMVPWRLRNIPGTNDLVLVTRGSLVRKGDFYVIRPAPL